MMKEAEANKEADEKRKEEVDARNDADSMIFNTEKALTDLGDKVTDSDKDKANKAMDELKEALKGSDIDDIKKKTEELQKITMDLGSKVYEEAAKAAQAAQGTPDGETKAEDKKDDNVEDANFEEK
jgi:molecular chaperone DnaK